MDPIFLLTGLGTVVAAVAGLVLTCHLERRSLNGRKPSKAATPGEDLRTGGLGP